VHLRRYVSNLAIAPAIYVSLVIGIFTNGSAAVFAQKSGASSAQAGGAQGAGAGAGGGGATPYFTQQTVGIDESASFKIKAKTVDAPTPVILSASTDNTSTLQTALLMVNPSLPVTPTITWKTPVPILSGTPLNSTQLNATATSGGTTVAGSFDYSPPVGTVLGAGTHRTDCSGSTAGSKPKSTRTEQNPKRSWSLACFSIRA
jgi:hypothetical protein